LKDKPEGFYVNWFRKNSDGKFLWPIRREQPRAEVDVRTVDGEAKAQKTPSVMSLITPTRPAGLNVTRKMSKNYCGDTAAWKQEIRRWRNSSRNSATGCRSGYKISLNNSANGWDNR